MKLSAVQSLRRRLAVLVLAMLVAPTSIVQADDWPQFRGPASNGTDPSGQSPNFREGERGGAIAVPLPLGDDLEIVWKVDLPGRGPSSPIVVRDRVIVTASSGARQDQLHVLAFDAETGKPLWERQFWATGRTFTHPQTSVAAPTPASDREHIFAFFSSNDLAALDLDGNLLWYRGLAHDFPRLGNDVGMSSSPLVVGETVIVQSDSQGEAFVAGINTGDGTTRWQVDRKRVATWTSPALMQTKKAATVLIESPKAISALDPKNGQLLWNRELDCDTISSACFNDGLVFVPGKAFTALRVGADGTTPEVAWSNNQIQSGAASPTVFDGRLLTINRGGVLAVAETESGKILSRTRLEGTFWSSPVVVDNLLFAVNFEGLGQLVKLNADGAPAVTKKIALGEQVQGSPAVARSALFVRSDGHLWKLATPLKVGK